MRPHAPFCGVERRQQQLPRSTTARIPRTRCKLTHMMAVVLPKQPWVRPFRSDQDQASSLRRGTLVRAGAARGGRLVPGMQFVGVEHDPHLCDVVVGDVETDDGGDLVVVAGDEAGAAVDGLGGQCGARVAGQERQQAVCDLPTAVDGPDQCPDLAAAVEERGGVRTEKRDQQPGILRQTGLADGAGKGIVPFRRRGT